MLKIGLIGFGRMGITHFSILNNHPSVQVAAICDQSRTMLNILKKYVSCEYYADYKQMMEEQELDCVVISTPTDSHAEVIRAAIDCNLHVFTEKPFAMNSEQGREILSYLAYKPLVNQVGYVNRFNEVFVETKNLMDKGIIGDIKQFNSEMYGPTVLKDSGNSWRAKRKTGGGCMYEFASHCIDLVVYLLGAPDRVSGSIMQSIYSSAVEDLVSSTFLYENGPIGTIMVNWSDETYRKPTNVVTIFGTRGKIRADKHAYKVFLKEDHPDLGLRKGWNTRHITDFAKSVRFYVRGNEFTTQLDYFVKCVEEKRAENISSFAEALKTDVVMEQIAEDTAVTLEGSPVPTRPLATSQSKAFQPQGGAFGRLWGWCRRMWKGHLESRKDSAEHVHNLR